MVVRDRSIAEVAGGWQRRNPGTPSVGSRKPNFNTSTSAEVEVSRPVRKKSYSSYADTFVAKPTRKTQTVRHPGRAAAAAGSVDWQHRTGSLLDHSRSLRGQTKALSHLSNMETMRQQQKQRHDDREGQEKAREIDAERSALRRVIDEELAVKEESSHKEMEEQIALLSQALADTERRADLNTECLNLREHRYDTGALLDESQRLLQKQSREMHSTRFQLTELMENLTIAQNRISPLHEMLELLGGGDAATIDETRQQLLQAQHLVNEARLRHNQIRHHVNRAAELIRRRTTGEEKIRLSLVDSLEQKVLASEDLLASLHDAGENAKVDLEEAYAIVLHESVAAQREELIMQLSLSVAAIEEDKEKKEQALEQDQRCHWYQTCDEMLPFDSALGQEGDSPDAYEQTQGYNESFGADQDYDYE